MPDRGGRLHRLRGPAGILDDLVLGRRAEGKASARCCLMQSWRRSRPKALPGFPLHRRAQRTKASIIYKQTGNLRAVQILLGHTKIESTVRYLGVDVEDAFALAEVTEI